MVQGVTLPEQLEFKEEQVGLSRATLESQVKVFLFGPIGLAVYVSKGLVINLINHPTLQKILLLY